MTIEQRAMEVFSAAVELDPTRRAAYLDAICSNDEELRALVKKLLTADEAPHVRLDRPIAAMRSSDRSGEVLGSYRLEALIGHGGMGSVYRAARADEAFDKPVAIKLLAFDAGNLRARFTQEQRILGRLSHAHIAALFDVGHDANGTPYFIMEYIAGIPITQYAREHNLTPPQRIELLLPVIDAVQTAHSQLVVHRDIKPSNVLIDHTGAAKLLDFGIAKLIGDEANAAAQTRSGLRALTPEYASPEQVRGEPVGTLSDIYSLGMLLYELLGNARPYEIRSTNPIEIARIVSEAEPGDLSARLSEQAIAGNSRDLSAIALKALEKTPAQRYTSCAEFASDLRRWLQGEAVLARLPTRSERAARYLHRHRLSVSIAATAVLVLIMGLVAVLYFYREVVAQREAAIAQKNRAERQVAMTEAVKNFLIEDVVRAASPALKKSVNDVSVLEAVNHGAMRLEERFKEQPEIEGELRYELGRLYFELRRLPDAEQQYRMASTQLDRTLGATADMTMRARYAQAYMQAGQSKQADALSLLQQLDALLPRVRVDKQTSQVRNLAWGAYYYDRWDIAAAQPYFESALAEAPSKRPTDELVLANLYLMQERIDEAERIAENVLGKLSASSEEQTSAAASSMNIICRARFFRHSYDGAEPVCKRAVNLARKIFGRENINAADALTILNRLQLATGRYSEAVETGKQVHAIYVTNMGVNVTNTQAYYAYLGHARYMAGRTVEGIEQNEAGLKALMRIVPSEHPVVQAVGFYLAGDYIEMGVTRLDAARAIVEKLKPEYLQRVSPENDWSARIDALRGQIAFLEGRKEEARRLLEPAISAMTLAKSNGFEIERARRALKLLDREK
jgi:serine/threonine-protein kinase